MKYIIPILIIGIIFISGCTSQTSDEGKTTGGVIASEKEKVEDIKEAVEDLEETSNIYKKIDYCTDLCAAEDNDIPYIESKCFNSCYQVYHHGGEKSLDELIESYKS